MTDILRRIKRESMAAKSAPPPTSPLSGASEILDSILSRVSAQTREMVAEFLESGRGPTGNGGFRGSKRDRVNAWGELRNAARALS